MDSEASYEPDQQLARMFGRPVPAPLHRAARLPVVEDFQAVGLSEAAARSAAAGVVDGVYFSFADAATSAATFSASRNLIDSIALAEMVARFDGEPVGEAAKPAHHQSKSPLPHVPEGLREQLREAVASYFGSATDDAVDDRIRRLADEAKNDGISLSEAVTRKVRSLTNSARWRREAAGYRARDRAQGSGDEGREGTSPQTQEPETASVEEMERQLDQVIAEAFGRSTDA